MTADPCRPVLPLGLQHYRWSGRLGDRFARLFDPRIAREPAMAGVAMRTIRIGKKNRRTTELETIRLDAGLNRVPRRGALNHHASHQEPPVEVFFSRSDCQRV